MKVDYLGNDSKESIALKEHLIAKGYKVTHIYSGSSVPIVIGENLYMVGAGNIRTLL